MSSFDDSVGRMRPGLWLGSHAWCGQHTTQPGKGSRFDLADAFGRHAVVVRQLVESRLPAREPAPLHDRPAALVQALETGCELRCGIVFPVLALDLLGGVRLGRR